MLLRWDFFFAWRHIGGAMCVTSSYASQWDVQTKAVCMLTIRENFGAKLY
jgi:hypothetical protein